MLICIYKLTYTCLIYICYKIQFSIEHHSYGCQLYVMKENSNWKVVSPSTVNINHILFFTIYLQPINMICMNICICKLLCPKLKYLYTFCILLFFLFVSVFCPWVPEAKHCFWNSLLMCFPGKPLTFRFVTIHGQSWDQFCKISHPFSDWRSAISFPVYFNP